MKPYQVYATTGTAKWTIPLYKYSTGIVVLFPEADYIIWDTESDLDYFDNHTIDSSLLSPEEKQKVLIKIFSEPKLFNYLNA